MFSPHLIKQPKHRAPSKEHYALLSYSRRRVSNDEFFKNDKFYNLDYQRNQYGNQYGNQESNEVTLRRKVTGRSNHFNEAEETRDELLLDNEDEQDEDQISGSGLISEQPDILHQTQTTKIR